MAGPGQPSIWKQRGWTPEDLEREALAILDQLEAEGKPAHLYRLADRLNVCEKTLSRYINEDADEEHDTGAIGEERRAYCLALKRAAGRSAAWAVDAVFGKAGVGGIAYCNNRLGWTQGKQQVDHSVNVGGLIVHLDLSAASNSVSDPLDCLEMDVLEDS